MDSVRFGRVLGIGTRLAAKTVASAIDAAKAPNPAPGGTRPVAANNSPAQAATETTGANSTGRRAAPAAAEVPRARQQVKEIQARARKSGEGLKEGGRRFGEAVWGPIARLSGVLWLEFTGVFFGLFALTAGVGAWKLWNGWHAASATHEPRGAFFVAVGMTAVFGYFCVSSFARAAHRGRHR